MNKWMHIHVHVTWWTVLPVQMLSCVGHRIKGFPHIIAANYRHNWLIIRTHNSEEQGIKYHWHFLCFLKSFWTFTSDMKFSAYKRSGKLNRGSMSPETFSRWGFFNFHTMLLNRKINLKFSVEKTQYLHHWGQSVVQDWSFSFIPVFTRKLPSFV